MSVRANTNENKKSEKVYENDSLHQVFYLEYNPYKNESVFLLNNNPVGGKFETYRSDYRLQQYLDKRVDWDCLIREIISLCR